MISNKDKIGDVIKGEHEFFFQFNKKHNWSISQDQNTNDLYLYLYPDEDISLADLERIVNWELYKDFVVYSTNEFKSTEASESFQELYSIVKSKLFGVDEILDDILKTDEFY